MTFGQTVTEERKRKGLKLAALAAAVGKSEPVMSGYENDVRLPSAETVEEIARALDSNAVRMAYLRSNPVYRSIIPQVFEKLNNIRREPAVIFTRLAKEADEAKGSALVLAELFSNMEPMRRPDFWEVFEAQMEQILDIKRATEIAEVELLDAGVLTPERQKSIYDRQQRKCETKGHHVLGKTETRG